MLEPTQTEKVSLDKDIPAHLVEQFEAAKPSRDPAHWAKKSCKYCYGRGIVGKHTIKTKGNNQYTHALLCICARKNYRKWKDAWLAEAQAKAKGNAVAAGEIVTRDEVAEKSESEVLRQRVQRIDDQLSALTGQIAQLDAQVEQMPHHDQLKELDEKKDQLNAQLEAENAVVAEMDRQVLSFQCEGRQLMNRAKEMLKQAVSIEEAAAKYRSEVIEPIVSDLAVVDSDKLSITEDFTNKTKAWKRRQATIERKVEQLTKRRGRVAWGSEFDEQIQEV